MYLFLPLRATHRSIEKAIQVNKKNSQFDIKSVTIIYQLVQKISTDFSISCLNSVLIYYFNSSCIKEWPYLIIKGPLSNLVLILLHDNAWPHVVKMTMLGHTISGWHCRFSLSWDMRFFPHPPYFPDLSRIDCFFLSVWTLLALQTFWHLSYVPPTGRVWLKFFLNSSSAILVNRETWMLGFPGTRIRQTQPTATKPRYTRPDLCTREHGQLKWVSA